jgi:hypothetical protein
MMSKGHLDKQRAASDSLLREALSWWEGHRPVGWDLRQHLDNPTVNAHSTERDAALAQAVASAVEVGLI